jgi:hypothetical protein
MNSKLVNISYKTNRVPSLLFVIWGGKKLDKVQ